MSCSVCQGVAIPDTIICPECLIDMTEDLDTLEPEEFSEAEDLPDECILNERPMR